MYFLKKYKFYKYVLFIICQYVCSINNFKLHFLKKFDLLHSFMGYFFLIYCKY